MSLDENKIMKLYCWLYLQGVLPVAVSVRVILTLSAVRYKVWQESEEVSFIADCV
jgi:hypothetical protein